jgi:hypothetical protein
MESQTKAHGKYRPMARALALAALTGIVVGKERSFERWLSPSLAWSICGAIWALGAVAMFSFFGRLQGGVLASLEDFSQCDQVATACP